MEGRVLVRGQAPRNFAKKLYATLVLYIYLVWIFLQYQDTWICCYLMRIFLAILSKIRHLKWFFSDLKRNSLPQAMFSFDIKRIFSIDLQQNPLSAANLLSAAKSAICNKSAICSKNIIWSLLIKSEIFDLKRILLWYGSVFLRYEGNFLERYEANFIAIWSNIRYLKWMFLSEANLYCDIELNWITFYPYSHNVNVQVRSYLEA